jgi:hypothetical protein
VDTADLQLYEAVERMPPFTREAKPLILLSLHPPYEYLKNDRWRERKNTFSNWILMSPKYLFILNLSIAPFSIWILNFCRTAHVGNVVRTELDCHINSVVPMTWSTENAVFAVFRNRK